MQPNSHIVHDGAQGPDDALPNRDATFADDKWFARELCMSVATIRAQRFRRRHGLPHWLDIDAVMIGSRPRWRKSVAIAWIERQAAAPPKPPTQS